MQSSILKNTAAKATWLVIHPLSEEDSVAVAALRSVTAPMKGKFEGTAAVALTRNRHWLAGVLVNNVWARINGSQVNEMTINPFAFYNLPKGVIGDEAHL
jgi:hypothetical protein